MSTAHEGPDNDLHATPSSDSLVHKRFGSWIVFWEDGRTPSGDTVWLCYCTCGTRDRVLEALLVSGRSTKCRSCAAADQFVPDYETRTPAKGVPVGEPCGSCFMVPSVTGRCGCS